MLVFPNAKINLGLNIVAKRPDGYHDLETVFYPVPLADALEVTTLPPDSPHDVELHQWGATAVDGNPEKNLVVRAYRLLKQQYPLPPVRIDLLKRIPQEAGLGGGSADAAFMLKLLNHVGNLQLTDSELEDYASRLGADCAFFIRNRPVYAEGIGNRFTDIPLSLAGYTIVIAKPSESVSTRQAFAHVRPRKPLTQLTDICMLPPEKWCGLMVNDFEESVFPQCPATAKLKDKLYEAGATYAAMSGSGSAVYGLFAPGVNVPDADWGENTFVFKDTLY